MARSTSRGTGRRLTREFAATTRGRKTTATIVTGAGEARRHGYSGGSTEGRASRNKRHWANYWLPRNA